MALKEFYCEKLSLDWSHCQINCIWLHPSISCVTCRLALMVGAFYKIKLLTLLYVRIVYRGHENRLK